MKKILMAIAAAVCYTLTTTLFTSCNEQSEDDIREALVGVWTEKNDLHEDILRLNENYTFTFQCQTLPLFQGSGTYRYERNPNAKFVGNSSSHDILILIYQGKAEQTMQIRSVSSSKLELTDRNGDIFRFTK